jgi:hypothetical protein
MIYALMTILMAIHLITLALVIAPSEDPVQESVSESSDASNTTGSLRDLCRTLLLAHFLLGACVTPHKIKLNRMHKTRLAR